MQAGIGAVAGVLAAVIVGHFIVAKPGAALDRRTAPKSADIEAAQRSRVTALEQAFSTEPRANSWAAPSESSFRRDLSAKIQSQAKIEAIAVLDVTCKTSICAARLRWTNYDLAISTYERFIGTPYEVNCGRSVYLPAPAERATAYEATLYFDCRQAPSRMN